MKVGIIVNVLKVIGYACIFSELLYIFYVILVLIPSIHNQNPSAANNGLQLILIYTYVFVFGLPIAGVIFVGVAVRVSKRVYMNAVGRTFTIQSLISSYQAKSRFEGMSVRIGCNDNLAVGDRVKISGFDRFTVASGRGSSAGYMLIGKKLAPSDPEYFEGEMNPMAGTSQL